MTECVVCGADFIAAPGGKAQITCSPECRKTRKRQTEAAWRESHECPPDKHGTLYGYINMRCDCGECRAFHAAYQRDYRQRKRKERDQRN